MPIAIAICEDENNVRDEIASLVEKHGSDCYGKGCHGSECHGMGCRIDCYESGESLIRSGKRYDIYMLDIRMPGISGLELSRQIRGREEHPAPIIVFITALKDHMQDAFDVQAYHFLVKPIDEGKFISVLHRAINDCQKRANRSTLSVKSGPKTYVLPYDEILFAESSNKKIAIQTKDRQIEYYGKISEFDGKPGFYRCHRCYIVNMEHIIRYDSSNIMLSNKQTIPLAKKKYPEFVKAYMKFAMK